ncbi:MAG: iron-sulfur cluster assembly scaffold protein, partial [Candidatus Firestonebacteria bacterium]|nr:iron-sulfur cluster assembly scaffold protein [Candidatus Firestonebacteria bacterium]
TKETISTALGGIPKEKLYCGELAITALFNAIDDYLNK